MTAADVDALPDSDATRAAAPDGPVQEADPGSDPDDVQVADGDESDRGRGQYVGTIWIADKTVGTPRFVPRDLIPFLVRQPGLSPGLIVAILWLLGRHFYDKTKDRVFLPHAVPKLLGRALRVDAHSASNWLWRLKQLGLAERQARFIKRVRGQDYFAVDLSPLGRRFAPELPRNRGQTIFIGEVPVDSVFIRVPAALLEHLRQVHGLSFRAVLLVVWLLRWRHEERGKPRLPTLTRAELAEVLNVVPDTITVLKRELRSKRLLETKMVQRLDGLEDEQLDLSGLARHYLSHRGTSK